MTETKIERVDSLPLLVYWLLQMRVIEIIDRVLPHPHPNRHGLSYGQLAGLFLVYLLHQRDHCLSSVEEWVTAHQHVLEQTTGWAIAPKEATDDRLGDLMSALGADQERGYRLQQELGQHLIRAYALPTEVARYDTSTFGVYHQPGETGTAAQGLLARGHSKDKRPDLLQFKQGLGVLDPAGIPLVTDTLAGQQADDGLYLPAWRRMVQTLGLTDFLYVTDVKGSALDTRGQIAAAEGCYLTPLAMTGQVPALLQAWVSQPPVDPQPIILAEVAEGEEPPPPVGQGFVLERPMTIELTDPTGLVKQYTWTERWLVTRSDAHAARGRQALQARLARTEAKIVKLKPQAEETAAAFHQRAEALIQRAELSGILSVQVHETLSQVKRYTRPGRPGPHTPFSLEVVRHLHLSLVRNEAAYQQAVTLAGWRIYVTNVAATRLSLTQAIAYYRDEWLVERGFHRFKRGSLPALPLWLRLPERIRGLMLLLLIALQLLCLLDFVAQRELACRQEKLAGLVPGNPKMATERPSAERLLARFKHLHLLVKYTETGLEGHLVEILSPLQQRILDLLGIPASIYDLQFQTITEVNIILAK